MVGSTKPAIRAVGLRCRAHAVCTLSYKASEVEATSWIVGSSPPSAAQVEEELAAIGAVVAKWSGLR